MSPRPSVRGAAAILVAASVGALSAHARASGPSSVDVRTDTAVVSGSLGLALSVGSLIYGTKVAVDLLAIRNGTRSPLDGPWVRHNAQVGTFTCGGVLLLLGGVAVGLQASVAGPCALGSACQVAYGFGATSLAVGVGMLVEGIAITTAPQTVRLPGIPFLSRWPARPVLVPFARGSGWGLGLAGPLL
jgi:hypothetical protein